MWRRSIGEVLLPLRETLALPTSSHVATLLSLLHHKIQTDKLEMFLFKSVFLTPVKHTEEKDWKHSDRVRRGRVGWSGRSLD